MDKQNDKPQLSGVKEIARRANVSIATVDRVIHNRKGVSENTRKKINEIIEEIGFQPNILASRLASKKVNRFVVLIPESQETDYWESPLRGIGRAEDEIKQYGVSIVRYFYDLNDKTTFSKAAEKILAGNFDGVLLAPSFISESLEFTATCRQRGLPYVFINSDIPAQHSLCYIGPHLYQSGYQAAHLISFGLKEGKILIVNISKEIDSYHHLLRKEEGFRAFFSENDKVLNKLVKIDIRNTSEASIDADLDWAFEVHHDIDAVFVTNSRVQSVAHYFEKKNIQDKILVGYDFLSENIEYLKRGIIDFLICQKPEEQGYIGIMSLFQHIVMGTAIEKEKFMPIDIITKENYEFYSN
ncbi:LacI family DNA-binding transcriptional regulator [Parapedobacter tibetensis]|uniref:LacI family DNA-binding transcriptional regulator n=1 Tax=Parapedobacter tibetensis TaxID=2972951 RepID=UPI00214D1DB6|nr:substrate-binding domain-containing protein [Parapedobacter tibetensis]